MNEISADPRDDRTKEQMPTISAPALNQLARDLLTAVGTDPAAAQVVADSLTNANLAGHDSHGVLRLVGYLEGVRRGHVVPTATPELSSRVRRDGHCRRRTWLGTAGDVAGHARRHRPRA